MSFLKHYWGLLGFSYYDRNAQVADAIAAQPSPPTIVCVAHGVFTGRLFVDDEAAGSGSDNSAPYLYECEFDEFSVEDL